MTAPDRPAVGDIAYDPETGRVGQVRALYYGMALLVHPGRDPWEALAPTLRHATGLEAERYAVLKRRRAAELRAHLRRAPEIP
ncbi:hypothetical protein ACSMX9_22490 [Streptomyces sp. LE64]|uniref:hypothetical protein n=1 Tax=Streptomyces sp. LE64 TaxID=3448653 RepID=UPI0040412959